jgi:uncharacterized protein YkwD
MRRAALALAAALCLTCAAATVADVAATAAGVVEKTNEFRRAQRLGEVQVEPRLAQTAVEFARYMARTGKYGHEADGRDPPKRAQAHGYDYCLVFENIAYYYDSRGFATAALARHMVEGWKNSPPHRRNMLNPQVTHVGLGVARAPNGYYYGVQLLGLPRSASVKFEVRNESRATVRYRVGAEAYSVGPRAIRTHEVCAREPVRFEGLEGGAAQAGPGDRFLIPAQGGEVRRERR